MFSADGMLHAERSAILPLMLLLNFAVFQYLVLLFHARWREPYVMLLLSTATLSWVSLVPFASVDSERLRSMNDVSEGSLALLLLVQTALVGTSNSLSGAAQMAKRSSIPSGTARVVKTVATTNTASSMMKGAHLLANLLILFAFVLLMIDVALIFYELPPDDEEHLEAVNTAMENVIVAFTFAYRFGLLATGKEHGWQHLIHDQWLELLFHIIFATHEYPFMILESTTGESWEYVQGLYMRLTLTPCIWMTIGDHHCQIQRPSLQSLRRLNQANSPGRSTPAPNHTTKDNGKYSPVSVVDPTGESRSTDEIK